MATENPGRRRGSTSRRASLDDARRAAERRAAAVRRRHGHREDHGEGASARPTRSPAKAAHHRSTSTGSAERLDALDLWTRIEPGRRRPRFTRDDIAAVALRIADAEGFDAVSMRRLAAELGAGTMTLYHYVRTKDELLALVTDAVMGELVVPADEPLPGDWRDGDERHRPTLARRAAPPPVDARHRRRPGDRAERACATSTSRCRRSRRCRERSPTSSTSSPPSTSTCSASASTSATTSTTTTPTTTSSTTSSELVATGDYPQLAEMMKDGGLEALWAQMQDHARDESRFDRNLARLLDGIQRDFADAVAATARTAPFRSRGRCWCAPSAGPTRRCPTSGSASSVSSSATRASSRAKRGAEAEVRAVAERRVTAEGAAHVEAIGVGILALVASGAAGEQRDLALGRDRDAVDLDRAGHPAGLDR